MRWTLTATRRAADTCTSHADGTRTRILRICAGSALRSSLCIRRRRVRRGPLHQRRVARLDTYARQSRVVLEFGPFLPVFSSSIYIPPSQHTRRHSYVHYNFSDFAVVASHSWRMHQIGKMFLTSLFTSLKTPRARSGRRLRSIT